MTKVEEIVDNLNGFGKYQKLRFILLCLSGLLPPIASYMHSFIAANPKYSCFMDDKYDFGKDDGLNYYYSNQYKHRCDPLWILNRENLHNNHSNDTYDSGGSRDGNANFSPNSRTTNRFDYHLTSASTNKTNPNNNYNNNQNKLLNTNHLTNTSFYFNDKFRLYSNYSNNNNNNNNSHHETDYTSNHGAELKCSRWVFDKSFYEKTLTEEWNLVCDKAIWRPFMQTIYFTGCLAGSIILSIIGRKYGQKKTLSLSLFLTIVGSTALSLGPQKFFNFEISYILLVAGRFLIAFGSHGISVNGYLLMMEFIGKSKKKFCALMFEFFFSFGQLVLVLAAYFLREWRLLTFIIIIPCLPFFLFIYFSNESIQFLLRNKKFDQIEQILQRVAKKNKTTLDQASWKSFLSRENDRNRKLSNSYTMTPYKPNIFVMLVIFFNWIVNNFVFHGLGLRANDLGINPYFTFALAALVELFCTIFTYKLLQLNFRRIPYFIFMLMAGTCCTVVYFSRNLILTISTALIAKFLISSTYAIMRIYSSELFPEHCRKTYLTKYSIGARVGSVIAPLIIAFGDYYFKQLPFLIFGISCFISAFSALTLPKIKKERAHSEIKIDNNQQFLQNNWLDVQDIYNNDNIESFDETELNQINKNTLLLETSNVNSSMNNIFYNNTAINNLLHNNANTTTSSTNLNASNCLATASTTNVAK